MITGKLFINGNWVEGHGNNFTSQNPANLEVIWQGKEAVKQQVDEALRAARIAFYQWMVLSVEERSRYLDKFVEILTSRRTELKEAIAKETGKPLWEADTEVGAMIGKVAISKNAYYDRTPEKLKQEKDVTFATRHKPHGVIAVLGPFNFPGHLPNGHIVPALLAGNTIVFKPSEQTPLIAELMVKCWEDAGLPKGVLNLVNGVGADIGSYLVEHPELDGIFFTGSFNVGSKIQASLLKYPHRIIALEMGGHNPLIIDEIEDITAAVYNTIQSAYITAGQRCTCARKLIVVKSKQNEIFVKSLVKNIDNIKIGPYYDDPQPFIGPVISNKAASNIIEVTQKLIDSGATVLKAVNRIDAKLPFVTPGLLDVTNSKARFDEEVFGPVLKLIWVNNLEEAITEANNTEYGLSAGIFTDKKSNYELFYQKIRAGIVNWNRPLTGASSNAPFGGIGKSGNHRPSAYYAADYCAYPVAGMESEHLSMPDNLTPGINLES